MKIVHTSDWHLNSSLGRQNRNEDISRALRQIAAYLEQYQVDVMLVSGDLFRERSRPEQTQVGVQIIKDIFSPFMYRGGTIIAISGNHDSETIFTTLQDALDMGGSAHSHVVGANPIGRLYLAPRPRVLRLADREGEIVQFVLMPYPTAHGYLRGEKTAFQSFEEKSQAIGEAFKRTLNTLQRNHIKPEYPSILMSHILVRGMQSPAQHLFDQTNDVLLEQGDLPAGWAYIALGHIHQPQEVTQSAPHMRYAGSVERLDFGESTDLKSIVLFEMKAGKLVDVPQLLPLESTTFYHVEITDPETQIPLLKEQYPDHQQALVRYILHWDSLTQNQEQFCQEIEKTFPRWYDRKLKDRSHAEISDISFELNQVRDVVGTVRHYLQTQLAGHKSEQELLLLAEQLLAEEIPS
jgi:DNA repair protein SbcD/Mre11